MKMQTRLDLLKGATSFVFSPHAGSTSRHPSCRQAGLFYKGAVKLVVVTSNRTVVAKHIRTPQCALSRLVKSSLDRIWNALISKQVFSAL